MSPSSSPPRAVVSWAPCVRRSLAVLLAGVVALLGLAAVTPARSDAFELSTITLYTGKGFTGESYSFNIGTPIPDVSRVVDGEILSARIGTAAPVALYNQTGFFGSCYDLQGEVPDLKATNLGVLGVASLVLGENCETPPSRSSEEAGYVRLCDTIACEFSRRMDTRRSLRDLSKVGFDDRATIVQLYGTVRAVALYTEDDFQGDCETVVNRSVDLSGRGGALVDDNTVSSLRLDYTCFGPLTTPAIVRDLTFRASPNDDVRCPDGYSKLNRDLNEGVGGDYIFACVSYGPYVAGRPYVDDVFYDATLGATDSCFRDGYELSIDLNKGAGRDYVYACVRQRDRPSISLRQAAGRVAAKTGRVVDQMTFLYRGTDSADDGVILDRCREYAKTVFTHHYPLDAVTTSGTSLNQTQLQDFDTIYDCTSQPIRTQSDPSPVVEVPSSLRTNGRTVMFIAHGYTPDGAPLPLDCGGAASQGTGDPTTANGERYALYNVPFGNIAITCTARYTDDEGVEWVTTKSFPVVVTLDESVPPVLVPSATTEGRSYQAGTWAKAPVTVTFDCFDVQPGSGVFFNATSPITVSEETSAAGTTVRNQGSCVDRANNVAGTVTFGPVRIDRTPPVITPSSADGAVVNLGQTVTASATITDALSGVATASPETQAIDTSTVRERTVTWSAVDVAGNATTVTRTFAVVDPTAGNSPPTLAPLENVRVQYSDRVTIRTVSADVDADTLTTSVRGLPRGLSLTSTGRNARIAGTVDVKSGVYPVTVTVSDGRGGQATRSFVIRVLPEDVEFSNLPAEDVVRVPAGGGAVVRVASILDPADGARGDVARVGSVVGRLIGDGRARTCRFATIPSGTSFSFICTLGGSDDKIQPGTYTLRFTVNGWYEGTRTTTLVVKPRQ